MGMSEASKRVTRQEWRDLGFHYDIDEDAKCWKLRGSRDGLSNFAQLLGEYCENPRHAKLSEHQHFGPYMYLKVMTWSHSGIDGNTIHGTLDNLRHLKGLVDQAVSSAAPGSKIKLGQLYAQKTEYDLLLVIEDKSFDPASADTLI